MHPAERIDLLIDVVKEELMKEAKGFSVEVVQLWYDDADQKYQRVKREDITRAVAV